MYKVVDLFAGAGGLSLGFAQTKKYDIKVAFENSPYMQETYKLNHPRVEVLGDVCAANYAEIKKKYGSIDVVIGGPPCQGFSNANRQRNHAISQNNMLVKQYIRAILELQPKAFVMENVSMLKSDVHRFFYCKSDRPLLKQYNIPEKNIPLRLIEKEYYFRGAATIVRKKSLVNQYLWPESHYTEMNVILKYDKNPAKLKKTLEKHKKKLLEYAALHVAADSSAYIIKKDSEAFNAVINYFSGQLSEAELVSSITPSVMIQRMLNTVKEIYDNDIIVDSFSAKDGIIANIRSFGVYDYLKAILESEQNGYTIKGEVLCAADYGAPQKRMRFVVIGVKKEISPEVTFPKKAFREGKYRTVRDAIEDIEDVIPVTEVDGDKGIKLKKKENISSLGKALRNSKKLKNHIITDTTETAMERFRALKQGENFHALDESMKTNTYTDAARTQRTIYLRLNYDEPSGTVVNVRKSMWIHPTLDRAISVREAARLQTFPDRFVFCGSKDKQYQQVGNAVPPIMAKAVANHLARVLDQGLEGEENGG